MENTYKHGPLSVSSIAALQKQLDVGRGLDGVDTHPSIPPPRILSYRECLPLETCWLKRGSPQEVYVSK